MEGHGVREQRGAGAARGGGSAIFGHEGHGVGTKNTKAVGARGRPFGELHSTAAAEVCKVFRIRRPQALYASYLSSI